MMSTKIEIKSCCSNLIGPVDVLFAGFSSIDSIFSDQLTKARLRWDCVPLETFFMCSRHRHIYGTVVLDAEGADHSQIRTINEALKTLDIRNVSVICVNLPEDVDTNELKLATTVQSLNTDWLFGCIESNTKHYHLVQTQEKPKSPSVQELHEDTADQLEMAAKVQRNFLPQRLPHTNHVRWAAMYSPAQWVSGDMYDISRLDETHIGFYLADAVGHSMPAALLTMFLKQATIMRQTIDHDYTIFKPWQVVSTLNLKMHDQGLAGCLFATCFYGLLNIKTLELEYARAGHPYPILIRDGRLIQLETHGGLLGVFAESTFEQKSIQLRHGDKLFVYSDGGEGMIGSTLDDGSFEYTDAFLDICTMNVDAMIDAYSAMAADYHFRPGEVDDVTAIALEIK